MREAKMKEVKSEEEIKYGNDGKLTLCSSCGAMTKSIDEGICHRCSGCGSVK